MQIAIVHLSDVHFSSGSNVVISRCDRIIAALRPTLQQVNAVIFAVTGDVAFSGSAEEYDIAKDFFSTLRDGIRQFDDDLPLHFIFIPGNHDCDFRNPNDLRPALLEGLPGKIVDLDPYGGIVDNITTVQGNFFEFEASFNNDAPIDKEHRLRYQKRIDVEGVCIVFDCYNTAWVSQKNEQQGCLLFPVRLLSPDAEVENESLRVSLLHHRDNWFEASNARLVRDYIETYSDLVLTGHEHVSAAYAKTKTDGCGVQYFEGAVLQDSKNPGDSGFNVVQLDLGAGSQQVSHFQWSGGRYSSDSEKIWMPFARNNTDTRGRYQISPEFLKTLRDPGTGFIHLLRWT